MTFVSAEACEEAFYRSFRDNDLDTMDALWATHEDIVCVHPGRRPLAGRDEVLSSWRDILTAPGRFDIRLESLRMVRTDSLAVHFGLEIIRAGDDPREAAVSVVNVFERNDDGWRMRIHHAGPIHEDMIRSDAPVH
jgi:uncharacterized protein (TIGR02246 family)